MVSKCAASRGGKQDAIASSDITEAPFVIPYTKALKSAIRHREVRGQIITYTFLTSGAETRHYDLQSKVATRKGSISRRKFPMLSFVVYEPFCFHPFSSLAVAHRCKAELEVTLMLPKPLLS